MERKGSSEAGWAKNNLLGKGWTKIQPDGGKRFKRSRLDQKQPDGGKGSSEAGWAKNNPMEEKVQAKQVGPKTTF